MSSSIHRSFCTSQSRKELGLCVKPKKLKKTLQLNNNLFLPRSEETVKFQNLVEPGFPSLWMRQPERYADSPLRLSRIYGTMPLHRAACWDTEKKNRTH